MAEQTEGSFEGWAIAEFMGHRKLGGYIKEQAIAGTSFIRLDVFDVDGKVVASQFYNPTSVYCITPCSQELAVQYGANHQPTPVTRWELPQAKSDDAVEQKSIFYDDSDDDDDDDDIPV